MSSEVAQAIVRVLDQLASAENRIAVSEAAVDMILAKAPAASSPSPASPPCSRCVDDDNYLPAYFDEEVKAWLHRDRNNEGYLCRAKHPNGFDRPVQPESEQENNLTMYDPNMPTTFDYRDDERPNTRTAATPPDTPSDAANAAATEICDWCGIDTNDAERVAAIIARHFAATENELKVAKEFIAEQVGVEPEIEHEPKEID